MAAILVLEDDRGLSAAIRHYMELSGYAVYESSSPAEALCLLRNHHIDCLVTDYYVENGTTFALIQELRRKQAHLPIIVVSGAVPSSCSPPRTFAWLFKPVDLATLERTIRRACAEAARIAIEPAS